MDYITSALLVAILVTLLWTVRAASKLPAALMREATATWKEAFVREIREARLENRKLYRATLPPDRRPD